MVAGEHGAQRHQSAELRTQIVKLRNDGLTFRQIAAEVHRSLDVVWNHYQKAMRDIPAAAVAAHAEQVAARREEQLRRIDLEREAVMEVLAKSKRTVITPSGKVIPDVEDDQALLAAVDRLVKLDDQEAKLLGLNAKTEVNVSGGVSYQLVGVDPADLV